LKTFLTFRPVRKFGIITILGILVACNIQDVDFDNLQVEDIKLDVAVPFGSATYTMRELIEDFSDSDVELIEDPETAEMRLIYRDSSSYTFNPEILDIQDVVNTNNLSLNDVTGPGTVNQSIPFTQVYEPVDGETLDSVFHDSGANLTATIESTSDVTLNYDLELSSTVNVNTGNPITFSGTTSSTVPGTHSQSLENHKTFFTEVGDQNTLFFNIDISGTLTAAESLNNDEITVTVEYLNQEYIIAFGKFGQDTVSVSNESLEINFFEGFGDEGLDFGNPSITFDFRNSFGMPYAVGLGGLYGEEEDGSRTLLQGEVVDNPPVIAGSPTDAPVTGEVTQTTVVVDRTNSSIQQLFATSPATLGFNLQGFTNPNDDTQLNFVTDTSTVRGFIEVEIPMEVRMTNVTRELEYDIAGTTDFDEADSLAIRVVTVNELPFGADMDMFIMEGSDTLYQALNNKVIEQPFLNIDRTVREPKVGVEDVPVGPDGVAAINQGDRILVVLTINTPESLTSEQIFVKLLATAKLEVTLGARGIITTKL